MDGTSGWVAMGRKMRLNKAVAKKKLARQLGERVAQSVGHTALLYRPGIPPILDLENLLTAENVLDNNEED
jgi:hypothetical protein